MQAIFFVAFIALFWIGGSGFDFFLCSNHHYYLEYKTNRLTSIHFGSRGIVNCKDFGIVSKFEVVFVRLPNNCSTVVDANGMNSVMKLCPKVEKGELFTSLLLDRLPKFSSKIIPGTNWCGNGNISDSDDDIGIFDHLDGCCRAHDMCPVSIEAGQTKFGIYNNKIGTISACECDDEFYRCLQNVGKSIVDGIGFTFFNILAMPCLKEDYPIRRCLERGGLLGSQCQKYELDTSKKPIYQLFDAKVYYSINATKNN